MQNITQQELLNVFITAIQTCVSNYPTYNYLTQHQNKLRYDLINNSKNPLNKMGQKYFSQNEEDGILLGILGRIGLLDEKYTGTFIEYGVGDGLENNSLILLMHKWKGAWAGNEELAFNEFDAQKLVYTKGWITLENATKIYENSLQSLNTGEFDVFSMDLDGNDVHFIDSILQSGKQPKVIITEYNSKFPPPIEFTVKYDPNHQFNSDYMGASIQKINNVITPYGYFLACCNITGSNAFYVKNEFKKYFKDIPGSINEIFMPPNYGIVTRSGHPVSPKTISSFISI